MELSLAKQTVIDAGKRLVETGLIARTWGNVSCRVSDTQFVITPSGRSYDSLTPDDIVLVNLDDDLSYDGDVKPSSEKGLHAQCYLLRSDVNFVIHTHQYFASMLSTVGISLSSDTLSKEHAAILGKGVPLASYGLPGTGKLRSGVANAVKSNPESNAIIMSHHGAVCLGSDYDNAFLCAQTLEDACLEFIIKAFNAKTRKNVETFEDVLKAFEIVPWETSLDCYTSVRNETTFTMKNGDSEIEIDLCTGNTFDGSEAPETAELHRTVYNEREDIGCIIHSKDGDLLAASQRVTKSLNPCLDDSAQIAGVDTRISRFRKGDEKSIKSVVENIKNRNALLIADNGALCFSSDEDDASAVLTVLEKNCAATVAGSLFGGAKAIGKADCVLMRVVYKMKYSKKKDA